MFENKLEGESRYHNSLAYLYAFLGEKEKAISQVKMAISLSPPSKDIMIADFFKADLAIIYAIIGEHEKSLDIIEELLSGPSNYSWKEIKYDRILLLQEDKKFTYQFTYIQQTIPNIFTAVTLEKQ